MGYSNNDEDKSVPYFWEKFDKENFSIWRCDYKYNDELTMVFMSCNLMGGMFQRLEKLRKNAFASMALFGENNNSSISGVWVWRGHDLAFELSPDWQIDYSSYDWKKLDADAAETKEMVNHYLCWTGNDEKGRAFNQARFSNKCQCRVLISNTNLCPSRRAHKRVPYFDNKLKF